jgi:hypothetical protein
MNVETNDVLRGRTEGIAAIVNEVEGLADGTPDGYRFSGADVKECLQYVLEMEAGSSDVAFQSGLKRDCDAAGNVLASRRRADGRSMRLADFVEHPTARQCHLEEAEVAGIRLYSTAAFEMLNNPLRDPERRTTGKAHPLPITIAFIKSALGKLRAVAASSAQANQQAKRTLEPSPDATHAQHDRGPTRHVIWTSNRSTSTVA